MWLHLVLLFRLITATNDTTMQIPKHVTWHHVLPCLNASDLNRWMQCNHNYQALLHKYLQTQSPQYLTTKGNWNELIRFINGMSEYQWSRTCQGHVLFRQIVCWLRSETPSHQIPSKAEQALLVVLQKNDTNWDIKCKMAFDLKRYLHVSKASKFPAIDAMTALICVFDVEYNHFNHSSSCENSLAIVFDYAQREYEATKRKYNRYTRFGMYFIENTAVHVSDALWRTVQAEFIPDFLQHLAVDSRDTLNSICGAIIGKELYCKNNTKYLNLFVIHKHQLFDHNEAQILRYAFRSDAYSLEKMNYFVNFVIDNQLMNRSSITTHFRNEPTKLYGRRWDLLYALLPIEPLKIAWTDGVSK
eukprot:713402_1